jgi:hypothetical protein
MRHLFCSVVVDAKQIARIIGTYTNQGDTDMTREQKKAFDEINARLETLEHAGRFADADALLESNKWILNYDNDGNWVGAVANENGWTA